MNFKTADKIQDVIQYMRNADFIRSQNRARIDNLFNGFPPWSDEDATDQKVQTNVNFLEAPKIAHDARATYANAFLKPGSYFTATTDMGPIDKRSGWSKSVSKKINRYLKRKLAYTELQRNIHGQLVMHGIGPEKWEDKWNPTPEFIGIEDLLVPSATLVDLSNLNHFAVYRRYTPSELYRKTHGQYVDPAWNKPLVDDLLRSIANENTQSQPATQWMNPEKMAEDFKGNSGYYDSDRVPTINCWDFYFQREWSKDDIWERRIVLDIDDSTASSASYLSKLDDKRKGEFLFHPEGRVYAKDRQHILHINFADGNNVAPYRYHSVRSLGWLLYAVCHLQNRLRCKFADAVFENMLWYFRNVASEDREKLQNIQLQHMGVIPEGVDFVPANERHTVDHQLVSFGLSTNRQLMSENSAAFIQDIDNGTQQALTATEVMQRAQSATALVGSMLTLSYTYKTYSYRETVRRFFIKDSENKDVRKFQEECRAEGIPQQLFNIDYWDIEPERVVGAGNKTLEIAQADRLMAARNFFEPDAQREILHIFAEATVDDAQLADRLVPPGKKKLSDAAHDANLAMGTLMQGMPVALRQGINHIDYVETILMLMGLIVKQIEASGGMTTIDKVGGLMNAAKHVEQHIAIIAQDPNEQQRVKQYGDVLGKMMNLVKGYAQRLQEQAGEQGQGQDGEIQKELIAAQSTAKIKEGLAQQKMAHSEQKFQQTQRQKAIKAVADLSEQDLKAAATIKREGALAKSKAKSKPESE